MGTRVTKHLSVSPESLLKRVPNVFRSFINIAVIGLSPVDLAVFETGSEHVVSSKDFDKFLRMRGDSRLKVVVVGYDFTIEVRNTVYDLGGLVFSQASSFGWTDESWHSIHQR